MATVLDTQYLKGFVKEHEIDAMQEAVGAAHRVLHTGSGLGSDFLGWLNLPADYDREEFARIQAAAARIREDTDVFIAIGIGGSYLGARAVVECLRSPLYNRLPKSGPEIYFAGNSISAAALNDLLTICRGKRVSLNVISKSGTTTEPAIAFRVLKHFLEQEVGKDEAKRRIYVTTDRARGTLKALSDREGYETFVVPDDIGGRYSVLTAVGLLPIAVAGCDIESLMAGAEDARQALAEPNLKKNDCYLYAALRNIFLRKGRAVEMMVSYEPCWQMMSEWFKQLFGESEGKDGKGLFPASAIFSTDLHSLGQFVQDGSNILIETAVIFDRAPGELIIREDEENADGLNFLAGHGMSEVNRKAFEGTVLAHADGLTPTMVLRMPANDERSLGYMIYFLEKACAISGYLLGVNPFDQPGVESYKKNMFALLGKPGYESQKAELERRLGR